MSITNSQKTYRRKLLNTFSTTSSLEELAANTILEKESIDSKMLLVFKKEGSCLNYLAIRKICLSITSWQCGKHLEENIQNNSFSRFFEIIRVCWRIIACSGVEL